MGKDYGIGARLTLNYDCIVLALLYMSLNSEKCILTNKRCVVNPLKKCEFCSCNGKALKFAGALSVIMFYKKLEDTVYDNKALKKLIARLIKSILKRNYNKAAEKYPEAAAEIEHMIKKQMAVEIEPEDIDKAAEPTAEFISKLCSMISPKDYHAHTVEIFGYYLGRWIYLMDAADDLENDIRSGNYNPFKARYKGDISETMLYCNEVLNMTAAQITMAYDLLDIGSYKSILDNIIYDGIANRQKYCLFDKYNQRSGNINKDKKVKKNLPYGSEKF